MNAIKKQYSQLDSLL